MAFTNRRRMYPSLFSTTSTVTAKELHREREAWNAGARTIREKYDFYRAAGY